MLNWIPNKTLATRSSVFGVYLRQGGNEQNCCVDVNNYQIIPPGSPCITGYTDPPQASLDLGKVYIMSKNRHPEEFCAPFQLGFDTCFPITSETKSQGEQQNSG